MKDYYQILGVLPNAEEIAVRAAYRVRVQLYLPDEYAGNKDEFARRMAEINEAYSVLSDPQKRDEYDSMRQSMPGFENYYFAESGQGGNVINLEPFETNWDLAYSVYPDLSQIVSALVQISPRLAMTYRIFMLESKLFARRMEIADRLEDQFLAGYFGDNPKLKSYGRQIILDGFRDAALALNRLVNILGDSDPDTLIGKIEIEYLMPEGERNRADNHARMEEQKRQKTEMKERLFEQHAGRPRSSEVYKCRNCNYVGEMVLVALDPDNPQRLNGLICPGCGNQTGR